MNSFNLNSNRISAPLTLSNDVNVEFSKRGEVTKRNWAWSESKTRSVYDSYIQSIRNRYQFLSQTEHQMGSKQDRVSFRQAFEAVLEMLNQNRNEGTALTVGKVRMTEDFLADQMEKSGIGEMPGIGKPLDKKQLLVLTGSTLQGKSDSSGRLIGGQGDVLFPKGRPDIVIKKDLNEAEAKFMKYLYDQQRNGRRTPGFPKVLGLVTSGNSKIVAIESATWNNEKGVGLGKKVLDLKIGSRQAHSGELRMRGKSYVGSKKKHVRMAMQSMSRGSWKRGWEYCAGKGLIERTTNAHDSEQTVKSALTSMTSRQRSSVLLQLKTIQETQIRMPYTFIGASVMIGVPVGNGDNLPKVILADFGHATKEPVDHKKNDKKNNKQKVYDELQSNFDDGISKLIEFVTQVDREIREKDRVRPDQQTMKFGVTADKVARILWNKIGATRLETFGYDSYKRFEEDLANGALDLSAVKSRYPDAYYEAYTRSLKKLDSPELQRDILWNDPEERESFVRYLMTYDSRNRPFNVETAMQFLCETAKTQSVNQVEN